MAYQRFDYVLMLLIAIVAGLVLAGASGATWRSPLALDSVEAAEHAVGAPDPARAG